MKVVMRLDCGHSSPKEPEKIITSEPPNYTVNAWSILQVSEISRFTHVKWHFPAKYFNQANASNKL